MSTKIRAAVYLDADVHCALRVRAAAMDRSISGMVNVAVKIALAEDNDDLTSFADRRNDRSLSFGTFVESLKQRGRI